MLTQLTLGEKLKDLRISKGFKNTEDLANTINIPKSTLNNYENDDKNQDVGYSNLVILSKFYDVSLDWLLGMTDVNKHLNTDCIDLGITDNAIDILKSKSVNNRLLCEIIENRNFADLMADIEIYVDGIATMQINTLNSIVATTKDKIKQEYKPNDKDYIMLSLERAKIKEDRYFHTLVYDDIDSILDDIRNSHRENKKDNLVAKDENASITILTNLLKRLDSVKGNKDEMMLQLIPIIFGVELHKLTQIEKNTLKNLFNKGQKNLNKL